MAFTSLNWPGPSGSGLFLGAPEMVAQIVFLSLAAMCLATGGFVGGLTWSARELGATEHRATGLTCCVVFVALGLACLLAGTVA